MAESRELERFLAALRAGLRGMDDNEAADVLAELRSHVLDSVEGSVPPSDGEIAAVLERLGNPLELASLYVTESLAARAGHSRSPWLLAQVLMRWARVSVAAGLALMGLLVGYVLSVSFLLAALLKPFLPGRTGLWWLGDGAVSLRLGLGGAAPSGDELLGGWLIPVGALAGALGLWLTTRFGRWAIRRLRRSPLSASR